jgi:hypothetical protein
MAIIDVYVIDDSKFDLTMFLDSALTWGDVGIKNIKDMADKLAGLCSRGNRIAELTIVGHGNELGQYVGTDWLSNDSLPSYRPQLRRLTTLFVRTGSARSAHVTMGGCQQGRNGGLLLGLSDIWNVPVSGYTALQRPGVPGYEGGKTTCYLTCARQGRTTADKVDEIQLKIMEWLRRTF